MGQRGPRPTPSHILKNRGSWRGNLNPNEPHPEPGKPSCPKHLSKPAKVVWRRITTMLDNMGVLAKTDGNLLERYCVYFVRWRDCEDFIAKNGVSYALKGEEGAQFVGRMSDGVLVVKFVEYPQLKESHRLDQALKQIEDRFGLSPSARSRVSALPGDDGIEDPKAKFFRKREESA
jgi:P27 family predicted phage terminase small subunit